MIRVNSDRCSFEMGAVFVKSLDTRKKFFFDRGVFVLTSVGLSVIKGTDLWRTD
jgi:hypothetical protein